MEADFSGWATKVGLKCSDGRTIMRDAFKHQDQVRVPLVWQHGHTDPENVLGHAILENRPEGVYTYAFFNNSPKAQHTKGLVEHKDITMLSIWANQLIERAGSVLHGAIREVSLVLSGANPGALIEHVTIRHSDGDDQEVEDEAIIYTGIELELQHADTPTKKDTPMATDDTTTIQDVYDALSEEQKNVVHYLIGQALEDASASMAQSGTDNTEIIEKLTAIQEGITMSHNVFEQGAEEVKGKSLSHDDMKGIVASAVRTGSLKDAVEGYALAHGIESIDLLFPDAKDFTTTPEWNKRRTEWVAKVLDGSRKSPFSRIKSTIADLTQDDARAKGYVKGTLKKDEWFGLTRRTTTPTTVYKKQKLDRDDVVDITDFDVVVWLKGEMRIMLEEELARAILVGDGRDIGSEDKVKDPAGASSGDGIRSIANDHDLYATTINVNVDDTNSTYEEVIDAVMDGMEFYKGSGNPDFYCSLRTLNMFLKAKDDLQRRYYKNKEEVAIALNVNSVVVVEVMNEYPDIVGIIVNLQDYGIGTDRGGQTSMFDDFDIDYNQYKYLIETRLSGALIKIKSALVIRKVAAGAALVVPAAPTFDAIDGELFINDVTGVVYKRTDTNATVTNGGSPYALVDGQTITIQATPATGYYFASSEEDSWTFTNEA